MARPIEISSAYRTKYEIGMRECFEERERERERGVDRSAQSQGRSNNGEQQKGV